jgi:hypothetical protein
VKRLPHEMYAAVGVPGRLVGQARHSCAFYPPDWPRRGAVVATSDEVRQLALDLADRGVETEPAVRELLVFCGDHRVPVVRARQALSESEVGGESVARAIQLLDLALVRGAWT